MEHIFTACSVTPLDESMKMKSENSRFMTYDFSVVMVYLNLTQKDHVIDEVNEQHDHNKDRLLMF